MTYGFIFIFNTFSEQKIETVFPFIFFFFDFVKQTVEKILISIFGFFYQMGLEVFIVGKVTYEILKTLIEFFQVWVEQKVNVLFCRFWYFSFGITSYWKNSSVFVFYVGVQRGIGQISFSTSTLIISLSCCISWSSLSS